ncbi:TPA: hypothetical protein DDX30_03885 [Candidatus Wolfebacteria bacterium]|nr:hypothetical protein [Candidatus Wolfebacteria bacterium]
MMAVEEINKQGGINGTKIEFIAEDNGGDAKLAVTGVSKLLEVNNADIILSSFTHITSAIKGLVAEKGKVMIYAATVRDIAQSNDLFFRDYYDAEDNGAATARLVAKNGYKNVAFLSEKSPQCAEFEKGFEAETKGAVLMTTKELYSAEATDVRVNLTKIKGAKSEAIVVCGWRHEHLIMKEMKELGMIGTQTFHWVAPFLPVANTDDMKKLFEENKAISTWYGVAEENNTAEQKEFIEKYQKAFGMKPTGEAVYAYDDIYILANAIKACDKAGKAKDSQCIAQELGKTNYDGVGGKVSFNDRLSNREITAIQVVDGVWRNIMQ